MNRLQTFVGFYKSPNTRRNYRAFLKKYFILFYEGAKEDFNLEKAIEDYFEQDRNYESDMTQFWIAIQDQAPKSTRVMISVVKNFLEENEVEISNRLLKKINRARGSSRAITQDHLPTKEELRKIFSHMPRARILLWLSPHFLF